ncbi:MAG: hypothetical protein LC121_25055 [Anaerolineae bacterium]|nr:hypothetical protein [Anaerolineae bacterium]
MNPHPYIGDELAAGRALADQFLERLAAGPVETDALAQQIELSRMGSLARMRGFAARLQELLQEAGHATD